MVHHFPHRCEPAQTVRASKLTLPVRDGTRPKTLPSLDLVFNLFDNDSIRNGLMRAYSQGHRLFLRGAITQGPSVNRVALTFDDGPHPEWTPRILDALEKASAKATFFMLGHALEKAPDLARQITDRGHEAAVHLFSHDEAAADDDARFNDELTRTIGLVRRATGRTPRVLGFPFAYFGRQTPARVIQRFGLQTVHWSCSTRDSRYNAAAQIRRVRKLLYPGAIILAHDGVGPHSKHARNRRETVAALPEIVDSIRKRALSPVRLDHLMGTRKEG